jgi:sec-independent protein translocase protein TatA
VFIFGTSRIADLGKGMGEGIRNFKKAMKDDAAPSGPGSSEEKKQ